jgi:radical SAM superfamily enzyme YgiQ (UPF0313 family)
MSMHIHLIAGARPFERAMKPVRFAFAGHGVANLTLPWLAGLVPRRHRVTLQDEQVAPLDLSAPMDLALITAKTCYAPRAYEIASTLRARGVPVVMGGCHASLFPDEVQPQVDALVVGEAEPVFQQLLFDAADGCLQPRYLGGPVAFDGLPLPRRELLAKRYIIDAVHASRGCSHSCGFCCMRSVYGPGYRARPVGETIDELRQLGPYLGFHDENLVADREHARELFTAMIPLGKLWMGQASVDIMEDPELIELAGRAGCTGFLTGMETISQANLQAANKTQNDVAAYGAMIEACHRAGIAVGAAMLFGLEHDTPDSFAETVEAMHALEVDQAYFKIVTPYPGTRWFDELDREGRILTRDWQYYDGCFPVFRPRHMTPRQLFEGACWAREEFYRYRHVARRMRHLRRLRLPWWAQLNMNRLARDAFATGEPWGERLLRELEA